MFMQIIFFLLFCLNSFVHLTRLIIVSMIDLLPAQYHRRRKKHVQRMAGICVKTSGP